MRWERLCVAKEKCGMGFRSLQLFNLAMLGKMGWPLLAEPNTFVCRVLKSKYFSSGDFLTAHVGHSPSFTWRSICAVQDLVRRGVRWRVGNGDRIRAMVDPWLHRDSNFFISNVLYEELRDLKVSV